VTAPIVVDVPGLRGVSIRGVVSQHTDGKLRVDVTVTDGLASEPLPGIHEVYLVPLHDLLGKLIAQGGDSALAASLAALHSDELAEGGS